MMLEILVTHLEKVCGLEKQQIKVKETDAQVEPSGENITDKLIDKKLAKPIEDTNLDEIVQLLKLL